MEDTEIDVAQLKKQNEEYKNRIKELETQLKKYTNNERHKKYYEKNKERIKQNSK
jgi:predicted ATP-grasp superfamily ATP-dependent carboligase